MTIMLTERELEVVINALNYASGEWANRDDAELTAFSDDAEALEARLNSERNEQVVTSR